MWQMSHDYNQESTVKDIIPAPAISGYQLTNLFIQLHTLVELLTLKCHVVCLQPARRLRQVSKLSSKQSRLELGRCCFIQLIATNRHRYRDVSTLLEHYRIYMTKLSLTHKLDFLSIYITRFDIIAVVPHLPRFSPNGNISYRVEF